jgi:hypothetical protein
MKKQRTLLILMMVAMACEEPLQQTINPDLQDILVVEGVLTNENTAQWIRLRHPHGDVGGQERPATGAQVGVVEAGGAVFLFQETPAGSGRYVSAPFRATFGRSYTLVVRYRGTEYRATDASVPVDPLPTLRYNRADTVPTYYQLEEGETGNRANYIEHQISWEQTPQCRVGQLCRALVTVYNLKNIDVNSLFKPGKRSLIFPAGSTIVRRKYAVSDGYKAYLRSMLSETEWRGGVFDVERGNAATNLSQGATGFFAVTTVVSDTTLVQ